jgi:hypothetical protein
VDGALGTGETPIEIAPSPLAGAAGAAGGEEDVGEGEGEREREGEGEGEEEDVVVSGRLARTAAGGTPLRSPPYVSPPPHELSGDVPHMRGEDDGGGIVGSASSATMLGSRGGVALGAPGGSLGDGADSFGDDARASFLHERGLVREGVLDDDGGGVGGGGV